MPNKCPQCGATLPPGALEGLCPACLLRQGAETSPPPDMLPFQPPLVEELARLFPQLEILDLLGKGGMGAVYKARQPVLDRLVALKILPPEAAGGPGFTERFNREARALARLSHPNIVAVFEFGQVNGMPFFIMEFVDGLNLRQLEQAGKLSAREALQIVPQICEALQFAHDEGIVHRDIKPENILVDKKGRVKIADFGIAKILGREQDVSLTETKGAIGTPHYMAPEQMENPASVDHRADIFSLGVVFYEMLTGELPLGKFSPPSSRKVEVDVRLDDVVLRSLEKDPGRRYQHVSQVKTAVDTIASTAAPTFVQSQGIADHILAGDYQLNIRSCFRRAWALVRSDFWSIVGATAIILVLLSFVSSAGGAFIESGGHRVGPEGSSILAMLLYGPLMGGLSLFYLKKIRKEPTTIETAFCGFSYRFLHLFLAGFVTWCLTALGFVCFILPGLYLIVAWWFTLTIVVDKQLDFWSAMEVSRRVVTRHWWKFLGFFLLVLLAYIVGFVFLIVGLFITAPVAMIAATYAYEDIIGSTSVATQAASAGFGPTGTVVTPGAPPKQPSPAFGGWKPDRPTILVGAFTIAIALIFLALTIEHHRNRVREEHDYEASRQQAAADAEMGNKDVTPAQREALKDRLNAALEITDHDAKNNAIVAVAKDAANAGEMQVLEDALGRITDQTQRNQTTYDAVSVLIQHNQRKQAAQIAKNISDQDLRNKAFSDLAQ
ncbi:MAG TPA: protein kinase [Verrucomicrobiae bacterium]